MNNSQNIIINATVDQPDLLENLVEKLAYRRYPEGGVREKMPHNRRALETSSTEIYMSGTLDIEDGQERIYMPFITCFLFTCLKGDEGNCRVAWSNSLS